MMITQQDLLKAYMDNLGLSREEFCKQFKKKEVKVRALNSYLLPTNSNGYRKMPPDLYVSIEEELIAQLNEGFTVDDALDNVPDSELIYSEQNGVKHYFPALYLIDGYSEFDSEMIEALDDESRSLLVDGRIHIQFVSFLEEEVGGNFHTQESTLIQKAPVVNNKNHWIYIIKYDSLKEAMAVIESSFTFEEDVFFMNDGHITRFRDSYFLVYLKEAPSWHDEPLLIYSSKYLKKFIDGSIIVDTFELVINKDGERVERPTN